MVAVHSELAFGEEGRGGPPMDPKNDKAKAEAVMRYVRRLKLVPFAFGFLCFAFVAVTVVLCVVQPGSVEASHAFDKAVGPIITWPISAHGVCLLLNLKSYHFQTAELKRRFMLLNIHASMVAMVSYIVIGYAGPLGLVTFDAFGQPYVYFRPIQWMSTTPAMLHQICMLADRPTSEIVKLQIANFSMLMFGLIAHVVPSRIAAGILLSFSWSCFSYEMSIVHRIFIAIADRASSLQYWEVRAPDAEDGRNMFVQDLSEERNAGAKSFEEGKRLGVRMVRHVHASTLILWTGFGIADILLNTKAITMFQVEHLWGALDVLAKVLFSSTLTMTGVTSLYEAEKQQAWLAQQRAAADAAAIGAQAHEQMRARMQQGEDRAAETIVRGKGLNGFMQSLSVGWSNVVGSFRERLSTDKSRSSLEMKGIATADAGQTSLDEERGAAAPSGAGAAYASRER